MPDLNDLYTKIGELVRARREDAGLTQDDLGERLGLTRTSVTNIENARQRVQIDKLYELAKVLGVPVSTLLPPEFVGEQADLPMQGLKGLPPAVRSWIQEMVVLPSGLPPPAALETLELLRGSVTDGGLESPLGMENLCANVLEMTGEKGVPISSERAARGLGIDVRYGPCQADVASTIYSVQNRVMIAINSLQSAVRQRFVMAHALGHLIIHNKAFHVDVWLPNTTAEEAEANTFASGLLVPHGHLEKDLKGRTLDFEDGGVVRELAEKYRVSVQVMATRISGISNP